MGAVARRGSVGVEEAAGGEVAGTAAYAELLADVRRRIAAARTRAAVAVNRELIELYWQIGREILPVGCCRRRRVGTRAASQGGEFRPPEPYDIVAAEFEQLAYEAALRSLDKQERLLEELRARTGVLLAASSIAASFLGQQAFRHPRPGALVAVALVAFVVSIGRASSS